jgi:sugar lactone lactonase YvrE
MRRFSVLAVLLLIGFPAGLSVIGCGRNPTKFCNGDTNGPRLTDVSKITLEPKLFGVSLAFGQTGTVGPATAVNCVNQTVTAPGGFTYATSDKTIADINPTTGALCGGTFNRESGNGVPDFSICIPNNNTGTATITANGGGASSNQVTVFVHPQVARTQVFTSATCDPNNPSSNCCPQALQAGVSAPIYTGNTCLSQNQTAQLAIQAFDAQGHNITCAAGHFVFTPTTDAGAASGVTPPAVVTFDQNGIATANQPGTVNITATAANEGSAAGSFTTCPPASIAITGPANSGTNLTVNLHNTRQLVATAIDTNGNPITGLQLTYTSTLPLEIPVSTGVGSVTPAFPSSAAITAACLPPGCNPSPYAQIGLLGTGKPVFSNPVQVHTPGTASSLLYLASTQSPSFSQIDFTNPTSGTATRLPYTPNSMVMSLDGTTLYFGSSTELMTVSTATNTLTNENLNVPGKVLAVSPDNTQVLISDPVRGVFYLLTTGKAGTFQTFGGTGTSAKWSTDGTTVYIAGGNAMYIYNTFTGFHTFDATSVLANDVALAVPAEAGFFAGTQTTARGACPDTTQTPPDYYPVAANAAATTDRIAATNDGKHILGVGAGNQFYDIAVTLPGGACPATTGITIPVTPLHTALTGVNASTFNSVVASPDSTLGVVTYTPAGTATGAPLPVYNVPATGFGTLQNVLLAGATAPVSAIFSPDGTALYVGTAGDGKLHVIAVPGLTDSLQLATNLVDLQNNPVPADLIAVRPRPVT